MLKSGDSSMAVRGLSLRQLGMPINNAEGVKDAFLAKPGFLNAAFDAFVESPLEIPDLSYFIKICIG